MFSVLRAIGGVFFLFLATAFLIIIIHVLASCSRKPSDAITNHELQRRTFVTGTTEALRNFRPSAKPKPKPVEKKRRFE